MYRNPYTGLETPLGLQEIEVPRISRQSVHECGKVVSSYALAAFTPQEIPMLGAQPTPGPLEELNQ